MDIDALLKQVGNLTNQVSSLTARIATLEQQAATTISSAADSSSPTTLQPPADWAAEVSKGLEATFASFTSGIEDRLASIETNIGALQQPQTPAEGTSETTKKKK